MVKYFYTLDLGSEFYDEVLLKNTVLKQIENIENKGGVRIKGWVKASNSQTKSEEASMELKKSFKKWPCNRGTNHKRYAQHKT